MDALKHPMDCLDEKSALEFLRGRTSREQMVAVGDHVTSCPSCKELIGRVVGRNFSSLGDLFEDEDTFKRARPPEPGQVLGGRFRIERLLGEGAMGMVFEAHDQLLDTRVALKFLKSSLTSNPTFIGRVKREILVGRRITHPNVARVYDLWTTDHQSYIQMELLSGETLEVVLRRGGLLPETASSLLLQIASALEAAHREGVVHRDLKPSNMMVDGAGKLTVTDFGLASDLRSGGDLSVETGPIGTPAYWAPEQARCEPVTPASDVFSFGVLAHYLLVHEFPAVGSPLTARLPPRFRPIIERCLQASPEKRYQDGAELMKALREAPATEPKRRAPLLAIGVAAAFAVGLAISVLWIRPALQAPAPSQEPASGPTPGAAIIQPSGPRIVPPIAAAAIAGPDAALEPAAAVAAHPQGLESSVGEAAPEALRADPSWAKHGSAPRQVEPRHAALSAKPEPEAQPPPPPPAMSAPPAEAPKADPAVLTRLQERLGHIDGELSARHLSVQDLEQLPETVSAARKAIAAGKVGDASELVAKAEGILEASKIDQVFIEQKTRRLSRLRSQKQLDAATEKSIDDAFVEASRAFFKKEYEDANEHLEIVRHLLGKVP